MGARVLIGVVAALFVVAACERTSTKYCAIHGPTDPVSCGYYDAALGTLKPCTSDSDCAGERCNLATDECVQCLTGSDCPPSDPICDPQANTCGACRQDSDCSASLACLPSGQCADANDVIYVDSAIGADTGTCGTMAAPCETITFALGFVSATRSTLKLHGAFDEVVTFKAVVVTLLADPGTTLTTSSGGTPTISFAMGNSTVAIYDLEIATPVKSAVNVAGGSSLLLSRVKVHGSGDVAVVAGGSLTITRSQIYANTSGGISIPDNTTFYLANNFIFNNGSAGAMVGGVAIGKSTGQSTFEFNTVVGNDAKSGGEGGVSCASTGFRAPNNIIAGNQLGGQAASLDANVGTTPTCDFTGSAIQNDLTSFDFDVPDFHLELGSTAIDASTVPSLVTEDIDGQVRPNGSAKDLGADEYYP